MDNGDNFIYHLSKVGGVWTNVTDGIKVSTLTGSTSVSGLTTNASDTSPTDFWIGDSADNVIYHISKISEIWTNMSDFINVKVIGSPLVSTLGMTTNLNGSDIWINDNAKIISFILERLVVYGLTLQMGLKQHNLE